MKTDRELLELAAKAIGLTLRYNYLGGRDANQQWDPLEDDGDALRLAVDLNLCVQPACSDEYDRAYAAAYLFDDLGREVISVREAYDEGISPLTATRRAIVRAAAAIGESMRD